MAGKGTLMPNLGLIDHPLAPLIVAWLEATNKLAAYSIPENVEAVLVARKLLNAELSNIEELCDIIKAKDAQLFVAERQIERLNAALEETKHEH
jgi:hypothetical protein